MDVDLFGHPMDQAVKQTAKARGYYAPPGTGPVGETCRTCRHCFCHARTRRYYKCDRVQMTFGPKTDIRLSWAACRGWDARLPLDGSHGKMPESPSDAR